MNGVPNTITSVLERCEIGDCWVWQGAATVHGYGHVGFAGKVHRVHRLVWQELVGPIPQGLVVDHLCRDKLCVNPDHMEIVTQKANVQRGLLGKLTNRRTS